LFVSEAFPKNSTIINSLFVLIVMLILTATTQITSLTTNSSFSSENAFILKYCSLLFFRAVESPTALLLNQ